MEKYTLKSLKAINLSYDLEHGVREKDVFNVNNIIDIIEKSRDNKQPRKGDKIRFTDKLGNYYPYAHIQKVENDRLRVCECPSTPFISETNEIVEGFYTSVSGGAWTYIPLNLKLLGTENKNFQIWGTSGPCGNGSVSFYANVNIWEYIDPNKIFGDFSTKDYDTFYLAICEPKDKYDYKYIITKGAISHCAFRTYEEYITWLNINKGIQFETFDEREKIIWTYKQIKKYVTLEEYQKINGIIDHRLNNGEIKECKRVYEGTTVTTFMIRG